MLLIVFIVCMGCVISDIHIGQTRHHTHGGNTNGYNVDGNSANDVNTHLDVDGGVCGDVVKAEVANAVATDSRS